MTLRSTIRKANNLINKVILILIVCSIALGTLSLLDSEQIYRQAQAAAYEKYKPNTSQGKASFEQLRLTNPDTCAWINIFGTNIDYPVVQGQNNTTYVSMSVEGNYSLSGSIFMDSNAAKDFSDFNTILYGHHMEKKAMFGEIELFKNKKYFEARKYGKIYFNERYHGIKILAHLSTNAYDREVFRAKVERTYEGNSYIDNLIVKATQARGIRPEVDENIILLSTCAAGPTDSREILVGIITTEIYADPFPKDRTGLIWKVADSLQGIWNMLPLWAKLSLALLVVLITLRLIQKMRTRHKLRVKTERSPA